MPAEALIGAIGGIAGSVLSQQQQAQINEDQRRANRADYERMRRDALEDWNRQNEYNSPQAQMQRLQVAGLNPHLVYGSGGGQTQAAPLNHPDLQTTQLKSVDIGAGVSTAALTYMNAIYDLDIKKAQIDNLKAQNTVIKEDAILRALQSESSRAGTERSKFDLEFLRDIRDVSADTKREQLRKLRTDIQFTTNEDARQAAESSSSLKEAVQRLSNMKVQNARDRTEIARAKEAIVLMKQDQTLRELDINLRRQGINPNDPLWVRVVGQMLSHLYENYIR